MKLLVLASFLAITAALDLEWESFKQEYGKQYENVASEQKRYSIWKDNLAFIEDHNKEADQHGYELGMNEYGDLTSEEFAAMMNGYKAKPVNSSTDTFVSTNATLSKSVDWREKGAVTEVKNQGQCGSCWSFSATGSLEGQHFLNGGGKLVSLSEQNLVDCSKKYGNDGCSGGLMDQAFDYIIANGGIDTEESYPYRAHKEKCRYKASKSGATMKSYKDIKRGDVDALTEALDKIGPISVAMDAGLRSFHFYKKGVYKDKKCSSSKAELDHGVLAVGYGSHEGMPYFLVKNSWGKKWGQEGYFMIERNEHNMCGIATQASYPVV